MHPTLSPTRLAVALALASAAFGGTAQAFDARAVALGGSVIAAGEGVPGALANPASLMEMGRAGQRIHFSSGFGGGVRDEVGIVDLVDDNMDLAGDIEDEIDAIDASRVTCEPRTLSTTEVAVGGETIEVPETVGYLPDDVCLDGLATLGSRASQALDVFDDIDGKDVAVQGGTAVGLGFTGFAVPFALHLEVRATGRGRTDVADVDRDYVGGIQEALADGELTFGEIIDSPEFTLDPPPTEGPDGALSYSAQQIAENGLPLVDVDTPEEELESSGSGGALLRVTFGASLATSFTAHGHEVDVGVTPKLSQLVAMGISASADEFFDDDDTSVGDRFDDSEATEASFTFDVGGAVTLQRFPLRLAAVIRNVVPESIETEDGVEFETTPQLVVGGVHTRGPFAFNADLALNEAEVDSLPTQVLAVGAEFGHTFLALRGGLSHDAAREDAATALTLGVGLGAFDLGVRLSDVENLTAGAQLSFSF